MPLGDATEHVWTLRFYPVGAASCASAIRTVVREQQQLQEVTTRGADAVKKTSRATAVASKSVDEYGKTLDSTGRVMFRYTYYALIFLGIAKAIASKRLIEAPIKYAASVEMAAARLRGLATEMADEFKKLDDTVYEVMSRTPYNLLEIYRAVTELYRVGRPFEKLGKEAEYVANLALISQRSVETEAGFLGVVLNMFERQLATTFKSIDPARAAIDMLTRAADLTRYSIADLDAALSNAMATAAAFGQRFEDLLTLITAFGQAGVGAAEAGTMVRQMLARLGDPDVMPHLEAVLQHYPDILAAFGKELPPGGAPALFDVETGEMLDVGRAMAGYINTLNMYIESATSATEKTRRLQLVLGALHEIFGIRPLQAVLALRRLTVEEYDKLNREIIDATKNAGRAAQYLQELMKTWEVATKRLKAWREAWAAETGKPLLGLFMPFVNATRTLYETLTGLARAFPEFFRVLSGISGLGVGFGTLAAGMGAIASVGLIMWGRMADLGAKFRQSAAGMAFLTRETRKFSDAGLFVAYVWRRYVRPIFVVMKPLLIVITALWAAWTYNLGRFQTRLRDTFAWIRKIFGLTEKTEKGEEKGLATILVDRIRAAFKPGGALAEIGRGLRIVFDVSFEVFGSLLSAFLKTFSWLIVNVLVPTLKFVGHVFRGIATVFGLGDPERGYAFFGKILGVLTAILVTVSAIKLIMLVGKGMKVAGGWLGKLFSWFFGGGGRGAAGGMLIGRDPVTGRFVRRTAGKAISLPVGRDPVTGRFISLKNIAPQAAATIGKGIFGIFKGLVGTVFKIFFGEKAWTFVVTKLTQVLGGGKNLIGILVSTLGSLFARFFSPAGILLAGVTSVLTNVWNTVISQGLFPLLGSLAGKIIAAITGKKVIDILSGLGPWLGALLFALRKKILGLLAGLFFGITTTKIGGALLAGGGLAAAGGALKGIAAGIGAGALLAGKTVVGALAAAAPVALPVIGIAAALSGIGYLIKTLIDRNREQQKQQPNILEKIQEPPSENNVEINQTIQVIVPPGTTEEQAKYIAEVVTDHIRDALEEQRMQNFLNEYTQPIPE